VEGSGGGDVRSLGNIYFERLSRSTNVARWPECESSLRYLRSTSNFRTSKGDVPVREFVIVVQLYEMSRNDLHLPMFKGIKPASSLPRYIRCT
jgi:hypothetical protein